MTTTNEKPRLRALDAQPVVHEGMQYLHLRDPLNLSGHNLLIPEPMIPVLPLLDGTRDLKTIQFSLILRHNLRITAERLQEMLDALDESFLLENQRYQQAHQQAVQNFTAAPFRAPALAGTSYPQDPAELTSLFSEYLAQAGCALDGSTRPAYRGLLSPHIDYPRGGLVYAQSWSAAAHAARAAHLVIILGTDHYSEGFPLSLTRQSYSTPFGRLPTSTGLVERLASIIGPTAFEGELHHSSEHSIELAATWLHYVREGKPVMLLPLLVGALERLPEAVLNQVIAALQQEMRRKRTFIVAAGDLSHVGPAFGGTPVSSLALRRIQAEDERILVALNGGQPDAVRARLDEVTANNVCGDGPLYLLSCILGPAKVDRLGYAACPADEDNTSYVTIAGVGFY